MHLPPFATIKLRHDWERATTEVIAREVMLRGRLHLFERVGGDQSGKGSSLGGI
jgi:hypothetical protein